MNKDTAKDYLPLVQALADGKMIQGQMAYSGRWEDMPYEFRFDGPAEKYRIKPEPREICVNRYTDGIMAFELGAEAMLHAKTYSATSGPTRYREVVE